jgi:hypothetical protein
MISLWLLLTIMLAALMYFVRRLIRSGRRKLRDSMPSVPAPSMEIVPKASWANTRMIKWISISEFISVHTKCSDLIVIDLRENAELVPFPIPTAVVLPVSPNELVNVLEWLPADKAVVLCGASDLTIFMIETSFCKEGSGPLYVLDGDLHCAEVA